MHTLSRVQRSFRARFSGTFLFLYRGFGLIFTFICFFVPAAGQRPASFNDTRSGRWESRSVGRANVAVVEKPV